MSEFEKDKTKIRVHIKFVIKKKKKKLNSGSSIHFKLIMQNTHQI